MWKQGGIRVNKSNFLYWIKVFEEGSSFGIKGGKISKLTIKRNDKVVCNYDRGWDIKPVDDDTKIALEIILRSEN